MRITLARTALALAALITSAGLMAQPSSTQMKTADGTKLVVHSGEPAFPPDGPHPDFAALDTNNDGFISMDEAAAYPPLVNDFKHADLNRDGRIAKAEYAAWH